MVNRLVTLRAIHPRSGELAFAANFIFGFSAFASAEPRFTR